VRGVGVAFAFAQVDDEDSAGLNKQRIAKGFSHQNPGSFGFPPVVHAASRPHQRVQSVEPGTGLFEAPVDKSSASGVTGTEVDAV